MSKRVFSYSTELISGRLITRYKRFLADIELENGDVLTAHCPNSGAMTSCSEPGRPVRISDSGNPKRKLRHTFEQIQMGRTWVGVNTVTPNIAVHHALEQGAVPELKEYKEFRREVKYGREGKSRIDVLCSVTGLPDCYVEVKNSTMRVDDAVAFPDAKTERGRKHLRELIAVVESGQRAVMFFFAGRNDVNRFRPADEVDPEYGAVLRKAFDAGVETLAYRFRYDASGVEIIEKLPVDLG